MSLEVQEVSVSLPLFCVFYFFKSISVKLPLSPVSFVDRPGSREGGVMGGGGVEWRPVVERRRGSSNVRKLED